MATKNSTSTLKSADHQSALTAPLPPAAVSAMARIERALDPAIAEQHRIERIVAGLRVGESMVINGTPVTAISLRTAELLARHQSAAARYRMLAADGDYDRCLAAQDEMRECRCQLTDAGMLHLIEAAA